MKKVNLNLNNIHSFKLEIRQKKLNNLHNKFLSNRHLKQTQIKHNNHQSINHSNHYQNQNLIINQAIINLQSSLDKEFQPSFSKNHQLNLLKNINQDQLKIDYQNHMNQSKNHKIWKTFLFKREKLRNNKLKQLNKVAVLSQQQKQKKVVKMIEELCEIMFQEITSKIWTKQSLISQLNQKIKQKYKTSHELHKTYLQLKQKLSQVQKEMQLFFKEQKQNEKERNKQLIDKRNQKVHKKQYEYLNLNLNDQNVKQIIQKKAKLNLQLDLSFQIQQRKILNQKKKQFQGKKNNLLIVIKQEKNNIQALKMKINQLQKQQNKLENQKQNLQQERKNLLKNLLKNPQYRSDGIVWTLKKMLQINYKPILIDLCEELDSEAKQYIIKQYNKLKKQFKPNQNLVFKFPKHKKNDKKQSQNRLRVKSMIINGSSLVEQSKNFFKFQFKNNFAIDKPLLIKKNTYNEGQYKSQINIQNQNQNNEKDFCMNIQKQEISSFKNITQKKKVKEVYEGTKKYINTWIKQEGWKSASARKFEPSQENVFNKEYIQKQKIRIKQKYHRIGGSNRKYEIMVKTLFGDKQLDTARKVKTSRN